MIFIKNEEEIKKIHRSCKIVANVLTELSKNVKPGITTLELNYMAEEMTLEAGAELGFKGYDGFPFAICASVNEQVVHGFSTNNPLKEGDIISIDFGVIKDGWYGDSALTLPVGEISDEAKKLLAATEECLYAGINSARPGNRIGTISSTIENLAAERGYNVVRKFVGHGLGRELHEEPAVANFGRPEEGAIIKPGMVIAIEPMLVLGESDVERAKDGWSVKTKDNKLSAHFEHTIAILSDRTEVLTKRY
jgi:methionyl aminopeptidase